MLNCKSCFLILTMLLSISFGSFSQDGIKSVDTVKSMKYNLSIEAIGTSNGTVPFWLRTNNFGSIPIPGASTSITANIEKPFKLIEAKEKKKWDWAFKLNARTNIGKKSELLLIEAFAKVKYSIFELQGGRSRDFVGIVDSTLSSGSYSFSGNSLGIPKVELSIPNYWILPFANKWLAIKGNYSHGWMGKYVLIKYPYMKGDIAQTYLHTKSLYLKIGKPDSRWSIAGGFNHQVMWGAEEQTFTYWNLSNFQNYLRVVTGIPYNFSKVGNHLGSIDQSFSYAFKGVDVLAYHQFFYEVGGLAHLNNIKDGLWGLSIKNKQKRDANFGWSKVLVEFLGSKSQGGELNAKVTPSGDEDYYNNYLYKNGWTYRGMNIGNNFFTNKQYARKDLVQREDDSIINNRLLLLHFGFEGYLDKWFLRSKMSFSRNYGTYGSSSIGNTTGTIRHVGPPPYFETVNQFSGFWELSRSIRNNYRLGIAISVDNGDLLYNSTGGILSLSKSW